jgi:hypothetical protein
LQVSSDLLLSNPNESAPFVNSNDNDNNNNDDDNDDVLRLDGQLDAFDRLTLNSNTPQQQRGGDVLAVPLTSSIGNDLLSWQADAASLPASNHLLSSPNLN